MAFVQMGVALVVLGIVYILAFVVPVVLHTLYDAAIIGNPALADAGSGSDIGLFIALAVIVFAGVWQIVVLVRVKKNAQSYCDMTTC